MNKDSFVDAQDMVINEEFRSSIHALNKNLQEIQSIGNKLPASKKTPTRVLSPASQHTYFAN